MGKALRKTHTAQFESKVGLDAIHGVKTVNELGQEYGVHPALVSKWKKEIQEKAATLFDGKASKKQGASEYKKCFYKILAARDFKTCTLLGIVRDLMKKEGVQYGSANGKIVLATNDERVLIPCAEIREDLEIPGNRPNDILPFRNKIVMKSKLKRIAHVLPRYVHYDPREFQDNEKYISEIEFYLGYPIFAKPIDDVGSRRTSTIQNNHELVRWCEAIGSEESFELDQFIHGTLWRCFL